MSLISCQIYRSQTPQQLRGGQMSRLITLQDWAKEEFGDLAPSERVLKKYAQGKMMAPPAIKLVATG